MSLPDRMNPEILADRALERSKRSGSREAMRQKARTLIAEAVAGCDGEAGFMTLALLDEAAAAVTVLYGPARAQAVLGKFAGRHGEALPAPSPGTARSLAERAFRGRP